MIMAIMEYMDLDASRYEAKLRRVDRKVAQSGREHSRAFGKGNKEMQKSTGLVGRMKAGFSSLGTIAKGAIIGGVIVAMRMLYTALKNAIGLVVKFNGEFQETRTLIDESTVSVSRLRNGLLDVARESPAALSDLNKALYQTISAGIDAADSIEVLRAANKAAVAGNTSLATSVNGITTALNAWSLNAKDATSISDAFFVAVRNGKTTFDEIASTIGRVAPLAATLGISLEETLSAMAALTTAGLSTDEAFTSLRATLTAILKPSAEAVDTAASLGLQFDSTAVQAKGLRGFLLEVKEAVGDDKEAMASLFPNVRALNGIFALTGGQAGRFAKNLDDMAEKGGSTATAFAKMEEDAGRLWKMIKNKLSAKLVELSSHIMPAVIASLQGLNEWLAEDKDTTEKYIDLLEQIGADQDLIDRLKAEQSIKRVKELFTEMRQDLAGQSIPISLDIVPAKVAPEVAKAIGTSQPDWVKGEWDTQIGTFNLGELKNLEDIQTALAFLQKQRESYTKQIQEAARASSKATGQEKKRLDIMAREYKDLLEINTNTISQLQQLAIAARESNKSVEDLLTTTEDAGGGGESSFMPGLADTIYNLRRFQHFMTNTEDQMRQFGDVATGATDRFHQSVEGLGISMRDIDSVLTAYNAEMERLRLQYNSGAISGEEFAQRSRAAAQKYLSMLRRIVEVLQSTGVITAEQAKIINAAFDKIREGAGGADEEANNLADDLDTMADAVSGIINLADAFGRLDDQLASVLRGSVDVFRNLSRITKLGEGAGFLDYAVPGIGLAAGVGTILAGIIGSGGGGGMSAEELRRLNDRIRENSQELQRNTQALREQAVVGSEANRRIIGELDMLLSEFTQQIEGTRSFTTGEIRNMLSNLENYADQAGLGPAFDNLVDQFDDLLKQEGGNINAALSRLLGITSDWWGTNLSGLSKELQDIIDNFGSFGDSLDGAIKQLDLFRQIGGDSQQAFEDFRRNLLQLYGVSGDLREQLNRLIGVDINTKEGQETLQDVIEQLYRAFEGQQGMLGDLTPQQLEKIINSLLGFVGEGEGGGGASDRPDFTKSVQIAQSITEIQANEVVAYLREILYEIQRQTSVIEGGELSAPPRYDYINPPGGEVTPIGGVTVDLSNANIGSLSENDIAYITEGIANELRRKSNGLN